MKRIFLLLGPISSVILMVYFIIQHNYIVATLLAFVLMIFQIVYVIDCVKNKRPQSALWIFGLVMMFALIHLFYWFTFLRKSEEKLEF